MSAVNQLSVRSTDDFFAAKKATRKIVMVTAYDAWTSRLLGDQPVDCVLVGDSVMMVVHGENDTLGATPEIMALHTRAVVRGCSGKFVVADMPFLSVRRGLETAVDCAGQLMRAGAHAVKIEGVRGHETIIRHLVESGIPVMGHLGLTPQSVRAFGGYKVQARDEAAALRLKADATVLAELGAFAVVLECIPQALAQEITASISMATIGIGAGRGCDGQVLVLHDLLGLLPDFKPRFVRRFADGAEVLRGGVTAFSAAVRAGEFPHAEESF